MDTDPSSILFGLFLALPLAPLPRWFVISLIVGDGDYASLGNDLWKISLG
jgi:hypothetical protein